MKAFNKNREMTKLKFKQNRSTYIKRLSVSMSCLFLIVFVMLFTFAKYESGSPEYVLIQGTVKAVGRDVNIVSFHKGNEVGTEVPEKGTGWAFDRAECTNGASASWDYTNWGLYVRNITQKTSCDVYFENKDYIADQLLDIVAGEDDTSIEVINKGTGSDSCTITLAYDGTSDNNLRYVGKNPCNYVRYNGESWRIIGVMNNVVTDGNDKSVKETLVKIRRTDSLGLYSRDSSPTGDNTNSGYGINQWGESTLEDGTAYEGADLMRELNTDYLGNVTVGTDGKWYSTTQDRRNTAMPETTISSSAQAMIQQVVWNTAAPNSTNISAIAVSNAVMKPLYIYEHEKIGASGKICPSTGTYCTDNVERKSDWYGKVGLMSPSDYGLATAGGTVAAQNRSACIGMTVYSWQNNNQCYINNWIYDSANNQWTINQLANASSATQGSYIGTASSWAGTNSYNTYSVRPTIYLKSNVYITGGDGTSTNPYTLAITN